MSRLLDVSIIMMFSGFFYYSFEGIFNAIFTPQAIRENMQDVNKDGKRDGYIVLFGFSSVWMILVGSVIGFGMFAIYLIPIFQRIYLLPAFCVITGLTITLTELVFGMVFLRITKLRLWDYSHNKYNYKGHIELLRSLAWTALGVPVWFLCSLLYKGVWL